MVDKLSKENNEMKAQIINTNNIQTDLDNLKAEIKRIKKSNDKITSK